MSLKQLPRSPIFASPAGLISRVLVEATSRCNLDCQICIRRSWQTDPGHMSMGLFEKLLLDLTGLPALPEVFWGGYGEPLLHPQILEMISQTNHIGAQTGLVTNGTLLTGDLSRELIEAGLGRIWISLDSAHQASIQEKLGGSREQVIRSLEDLLEIRSVLSRHRANSPGPGIGLALVVGQDTLPQVLELIELGHRLGVDSIFLTNPESYSADQARQVFHPAGSEQLQTELSELIIRLERSGKHIQFAGSLVNPSQKCPFAEKGELAVRWDGEVSPCLPLLYDHTSFLGSWQRQIHAFSLGNLASLSLAEIWSGRKYTELQSRLLGEDFSPCFSCRNCWFSEDNLLDCMGYEHPTCGGCLWAQGLVACP